MGAHSIYAPSSMHRAITCPASVKLVQALKGGRETLAAAEGTVAHWIAEWCMRHNIAPFDLYGDWFNYMGHGEVSTDPVDSLDAMFAFQVDDEMAQHLTGYIAHCKRRPGDKHIEVRVDISPWTPIPEQKGTSDHVAIDIRGGTLYVDDLKYGKGVKVAPKENWQAISYALGTINMLRGWPKTLAKIKRVVIGIYQPRLENIDEWETTVEEILERGEYMKKRLALAELPNPPFGPDPKACEFCPVVLCRARREALAANMPNEEGEEFDKEEVKTYFLTDDEAAEMLLLRPWYDKFFNHLHDYLFKQVTDRKPNNVVRLGEGNQKRFWKDRDRAISYLEKCGVHDIFDKPKMLSPAKAEKALRGEAKKNLQTYIGSSPGAPRLVPMNSKHRAYGSQMLANMPNEEEDEFGLT